MLLLDKLHMNAVLANPAVAVRLTINLRVAHG